MEEKEILMSINDRLGIIAALIKAANIAVGNMEYFTEDGQSIAIILDIASTRLEECRRLLDPIKDI